MHTFGFYLTVIAALPTAWLGAGFRGAGLSHVRRSLIQRAVSSERSSKQQLWGNAVHMA